jgi:hypothetical protein
MAASSVITVRIDPQLRAALKEKARREGRTLSATIVRLIQSDVKRTPSRSDKVRRTIGMFRQFEAPDLDELRGLRRTFSSSLQLALPRARRKRA